MSLRIDELDANISFEDAKPAPKWIIGSGQKIYWRDCFVRVYTSTDRQFAKESFETCDGQVTVPEGKELFLGGRGGRVKE